MHFSNICQKITFFLTQTTALTLDNYSYSKYNKYKEIHMDNIKKSLQENNLTQVGDVIGVAVSGGKDSMALLHYLHNLSKTSEFEVVAITVDHALREESASDALFVMEYCKQNRIRAYKFRVDCYAIAKDNGISIESAARQARYGVFDAMIKKGVVNKIALAHHEFDQAETILLNLFRGTGLNGIKGMQPIRDGVYIRPMLKTNQNNVIAYVSENNIPTVEDKTNLENDYSRNYLRNEIMPLILTKWPNAINSLVSFAKLASQDDEYISSLVPFDSILISDKQVKIPVSYFIYPAPVVSRMIFKALNAIGVTCDIENKHIEKICNLVSSQNGKKIDLPLQLAAIKEYDYLTIINKQKDQQVLNHAFKLGSFFVENFGKIIIKRTTESTPDQLYLDAQKVPKSAVWRFRKDGDIFKKFGGGTKKLKNYLIDIKLPARQRKNLPVLANGNDILAIAGVEISDDVKTTPSTKTIYSINVIRS